MPDPEQPNSLSSPTVEECKISLKCTGPYCSKVALRVCTTCEQAYCDFCLSFEHNSGLMKKSEEEMQQELRKALTFSFALNPPKSQKLLVVLDLDQTLLYSVPRRNYIENNHPDALQPDFSILGGAFQIYLRPHVQEFLMVLLLKYDVAVWTAGSKSYANALMTELFPCKQHRDSLLFVNDLRHTIFPVCFLPCGASNITPVKMLENIQHVCQQGLQRIVAIDDTICTFTSNPQNGILVPEFSQPETQRGDTILLSLLQFLNFLDLFQDVRKVDKQDWLLKFSHAKKNARQQTTNKFKISSSST